MRKMVFFVITLAIILGIAGLCMVFAEDEDDLNIKFLGEYGWETEEERIEAEKVEIPLVFDEVYNNYNELQRLAGLDLSGFKGKKAVRYTYVVTNFPNNDKNEQIRANVLCVAGKPVAGDVMTVRLDGFMYSLNYLRIGK